MNNAWLVRPYPNGESRIKEFRQDNLVAIGWMKLGDLTGESRSNIKQLLSDAPYNLSGIALGNAYATVDIFVNRMNVGDIVLVPDGDDIYFAEICSDYYYINSKNDYSHQRKVNWLKSVARYELSKSLRSSLKVHRSTADLSKHYNEINALSHNMNFKVESNEIETLKVSYPLRKDFVVNFEIPVDITKDESKRLAQHLETLYYA